MNWGSKVLHYYIHHCVLHGTQGNGWAFPDELGNSIIRDPTRGYDHRMVWTRERRDESMMTCVLFEWEGESEYMKPSSGAEDGSSGGIPRPRAIPEFPGTLDAVPHFVSIMWIYFRKASNIDVEVGGDWCDEPWFNKSAYSLPVFCKWIIWAWPRTRFVKHLMISFWQEAENFFLEVVPAGIPPEDLCNRW